MLHAARFRGQSFRQMCRYNDNPVAISDSNVARKNGNAAAADGYIYVNGLMFG
jgi:hypothetical protein